MASSQEGVATPNSGSFTDPNNQHYSNNNTSTANTQQYNMSPTSNLNATTIAAGNANFSALHLPVAAIPRLREIFLLFDENRTGHVNLRELPVALSLADLEASHEERTGLVAVHCQDKEKGVTEAEFLNICDVVYASRSDHPEFSQHQQLLRAFDAMANNEHGVVPMEGVLSWGEEVMRACGECLLVEHGFEYGKRGKRVSSVLGKSHRRRSQFPSPPSGGGSMWKNLSAKSSTSSSQQGSRRPSLMVLSALKKKEQKEQAQKFSGVPVVEGDEFMDDDDEEEEEEEEEEEDFVPFPMEKTHRRGTAVGGSSSATNRALFGSSAAAAATSTASSRRGSQDSLQQQQAPKLIRRRSSSAMLVPHEPTSTTTPGGNDSPSKRHLRLPEVAVQQHTTGHRRDSFSENTVGGKKLLSHHEDITQVFSEDDIESTTSWLLEQLGDRYKEAAEGDKREIEMLLELARAAGHQIDDVSGILTKDAFVKFLEDETAK